MNYLGKGKIEHDNHQQSDILRSVDLRSFRNNECDLIYGGNGSIKKQHLCAYYEGLIKIFFIYLITYKILYKSECIYCMKIM